MDTFKNTITKNQITRILSLLMVFVLAIGVISCDDDNPSSVVDEQPSIVEIAQSDNNFSTLVAALQDADLVGALEGNGPFTVFAPTNAAFDKLPDGLIASLNQDQLVEILSYHVISSNVKSTDLSAEQVVGALAGGQLFVTANDNVVVNDLATVITADIEASNGVIHAIDEVLLPDAFLDIVGVITKRYALQTLESAVVDAGLASALQTVTDNGFTVFAPQNDAFNGVDVSTLTIQQLGEVLTYHVIPAKVLSSDLASSQEVETLNGETLLIEVQNNVVSITDSGGSVYQVVEADIEGTNGVVHVINGILQPI